MTVVAGNRLETLADDLAARLGRGRDVFAKETVVVPSKGTARWLVSWIAKRKGVCANIDFRLPKDFIAGDLCGLSGESAQACAQEHVRWRIFEAFPRLIAQDKKSFAAPAAYIEEGGPDSPVKRWQLAGKLAGCFDQYITLRPDMVIDWESRPDAPAPPESFGKRSDQWLNHWRWQRALWLETMSKLETHLPREFARILNGGLRREGLPRRVFAFGFSTMPPVYLDIFAALGKRVETVLHYLNPCQGYWAEIRSEKEALRELAKFNPDSWCEMHMDEPNELLASFGKTGREFFARLVDSSESFDLEEIFTEPEDAPRDILGAIQRGVYDMLPAKELGQGVKPSKRDGSVKIHSCHSRMREVETLRDEILDILESRTRPGVKDPMRPSDIIVMAPDISKYAPFIRAVFGGDRRGGLKIDFSIADQSLGAETPEAAAFMALLRIPQGRFTAEEVMAPLDCQAARERLKLSPEDIEWLRAKLREAGAAWGIDASHRREVMERDGSGNPPAFEENSWRFALDRIILGHAMERATRLEETLSPDGRPIAPVGIGEGDGAEAAGRFAVYFDKLEAFEKAALEENTIAKWQTILPRLIEDFLLPESSGSDGAIATMKAVSGMLSTAALALGPDSPLPYDVVLAAANEVVSSESSGGGFLRGGVTFCRMQPLRNIPARAVCLLGMNDKEFPRADKERGFDLLREGRRLCDRSPRDDDRQLFLDAILSARDCLRILYVGQSDKDNSSLPPSPAVEELEDHLKAAFGKDCLKLLRLRHPLHPFSAKYFSAEARDAWRERAGRSGDDDWSFDVSSFSFPDLEAARALASRERLPAPPWACLFEPLPPPDNLSEGVFERSTDELAYMLRNLPKQLLRNRLGLTIEEPGDDSLPDDEPFIQDALQDYQLKDALLKSLLENPALTVKDAYRLHRACGELSGGAFGYMRFSERFDGVKAFSESLSSKLGARRAPLRLAIELGAADLPDAATRKALFPNLPEKPSMRITLKNSNIFENGLAFFRPSSLKAKDYLAAWIGHLALNAAESAPSRQGVLFGLQGESIQCESFRPMERCEARRLLALLAALCVEGLCRPLPLFPESSKEYAKGFKDSEEGETALALSLWPRQDFFKGADREWEQDDFGKVAKESEEPSFRFCFGAAPLSKLSSETAIEDRIAALGAGVEGECQEWIGKASPDKLKLFRRELELERLFHISSLLCFLPLHRGLAPKEGRASR